MTDTPFLRKTTPRMAHNHDTLPGRTAMKALLHIPALMLALSMAACSNPPPPEAVPEDAAGYQGRYDTGSLRNADAVGYDGAAIQKKLDGALDKNDQRAADLRKRIDAQTGDAAVPEDR